MKKLMKHSLKIVLGISLAIFAEEIDEYNCGKEMIALAGELEIYYKQTSLPKTREEFENRAILVRYFSDIQYLLEIKYEFTKKSKMMS